MNATNAAAFAILRDSFDMLRDAVKDLPDDAFDWTPLPETSSLAVLVTHVLTSTRFFVMAGAGGSPSRKHYIEEEREAAFRTRGGSANELTDAIEQAVDELRALLEAGSDDSLARVVEWDTDAPAISGAECLFRAVGHLREHVGHAQLMRDLWLAEHVGA